MLMLYAVLLTCIFFFVCKIIYMYNILQYLSFADAGEVSGKEKEVMDGFCGS